MSLEYRKLMARPIDEIGEDISFRPDNFQVEPWYGDFQMYIIMGFCHPPEEYALQVRKALKVMGMSTHTVGQGDGKTYVLPGEARQTAPEPKVKNFYDRRGRR